MDFTNRTSRPQEPGAGPGGPDSTPSGVKNTKSSKLSRFKKHALLNVTYLGLLFSLTIVMVGVLLALFFFEGTREDKYVDNTKHQAIFLNNGQVYFGTITDLNKDFLTLGNIYYLRVNQQVQPGQQASQNDVSLVKLGCELHGPQDLMIVNRDQVTFWENLKSDGQVAEAIAQYVEANPDGQDCSQQQQQSTEGTAPPSTETETDTATPTPDESADDSSTPAPDTGTNNGTTEENADTTGN